MKQLNRRKGQSAQIGATMKGSQKDIAKKRERETD